MRCHIIYKLGLSFHILNTLTNENTVKRFQLSQNIELLNCQLFSIESCVLTCQRPIYKLGLVHIMPGICRLSSLIASQF